MSRHQSVWTATSEQPPYPALDGEVDADVVVVGAGITGLTTALLLQRDGARVVVVEAGRVGGGTTGGTTGKVTSQHGLTYHQLVSQHGEARARLYAGANQRAVDTVAGLVEEVGADCQFERAAAFVYTESADLRPRLEAEHAAAARLGLPASLTTTVDLPFDVELALRFDDQAHIHAGRYTAALALAVTAGGGRIFENTRVLGVDEPHEKAVAHAEGGDARGDFLVVATLLPFVDRGGFFARAVPGRSYGIAVRLDEDAPPGMHITAGSPTRSTRPWREGDHQGLIVVGEGHHTGDVDVSPARWGALERWTRERFRVRSIEYRWSAQDYTTVDDVPYVGRSPRMSRTLVATGFRKWGLTNGTAAAEMLADLVAGRDNPWLPAFDATRIGGAQAVKRLVEANAHVATRFVVDRIARLRAGHVTDLPPGQGRVVDLDGKAVGAYRDAAGELHAVGLSCTHLGCTLRWNGAETTWDCPCHGSRFSHEGTVVEGPAVRPLEQVDVDPGM